MQGLQGLDPSQREWIQAWLSRLNAESQLLNFFEPTGINELGHFLTSLSVEDPDRFRVFVLGTCTRPILNQLEQLILKHHIAGSCRQILSERKRVVTESADMKRIFEENENKMKEMRNHLHGTEKDLQMANQIIESPHGLLDVRHLECDFMACSPYV